MFQYNQNTRSEFSSGMTEEVQAVWRTPLWLFRKLDSIYHFTLDACAQEGNALCPNFFTEEENGLLMPWKGHRVYCFPPGGRGKNYFLWTAKSLKESRAKDTIVVMLLPASTDSKWFQQNILMQPGVIVSFLDARLSFENPLTPSYASNRSNDKRKGSHSMRPSMIVVFTGKKKKFACESFHVEED